MEFGLIGRGGKKMLIGGIEAGGTKFVCAVGDETGTIIEKVSFPTEGPKETFQAVKRFFDQYDITSIGIGSFGPIDLDQESATYGMILNTPKTKWQQFNVVKELKELFQIPVSIDTDVNVACLGESMYGAGKEVDSCLYMTVGTGIGAGFVRKGEIFQGKNHSEMGHIFLQKHPEDTYAGNCPSHKNCLEGLAAGPAIEDRYGQKGIALSDNEKVWEIEAYYLAQAIMNYTLVLSPERIIIGGGVMKQEKLYDLIRKEFMKLMNGYLTIENVEQFIVAPELDDEQGIKGAITLGMIK